MAKSFPEILNQMNVIQKDKGAYAALLGEAHQYLVTGILMRLGFLVSVITVRAGTFDIIVPAFEDFAKEQQRNVLLRAQVKTVKKSLKFIGGTRAGVDRKYIPKVKEYKYSTQHNDLIIGVDPDMIDLFFVPTRFITRWGDSVSKNKLLPLKNRFEILLNWNDKYLNSIANNLK